MKRIMKVALKVAMWIIKAVWDNLYSIMAIYTAIKEMWLLAFMCAVLMIGDEIRTGFDKISNEQLKKQTHEITQVFVDYLERNKENKK